jgi:hypothetical protein
MSNPKPPPLPPELVEKFPARELPGAEPFAPVAAHDGFSRHAAAAFEPALCGALGVERSASRKPGVGRSRSRIRLPSAQKLRPAVTGTLLLVVELFPSWPLLLEPQHWTPPFTSAQVWVSPAAMAWTPLVELFPSWPELL